MNKILFLAILLVPGSVAFGQKTMSQSHTRPLAALRSIRANAQEAGENAAIYQWARVNREVDRVVEAERGTEKASADAASLAALQQSVRALRAARLAHDVARLQQSAQDVVAACDALIR